MKARKGSWVRIRNTVLRPEERTGSIPEDTAETPLLQWNKGFLLGEAEAGDIVEIETYIGRRIRGELVEVNPRWDHDYGDFVPELLYIGRQLRNILSGEEDTHDGHE